MKIESLEISNYSVHGGAYSTVLIDKNRKSALKLFKSYFHPDLDGTDKEIYGSEMINNYRKRVFESEVDAYSKVQKSETLKIFTPTFYGTIQFDQVLYNQHNISNQYLPDCCIHMEFIEGDDYKIIELLASDDLLEYEKKFNFSFNSIIQQFKDNGILYINDASVIINEKGIKIIDFSTSKVGDYPYIDE